MKKIWFLKAMGISLLLFIALFLITTSIQAQSYNNFPYNYDDFSIFDSWFPPFAMNFQNNYRYGQSNWGTWQVNNSPIYAGWEGAASYLPWGSLNGPIWENALYNSPSLGSSNPALMPRLSSESSPSWLNYAPINYGPVFPSWKNWGSPSFYAEPPPTNLSPLGGSPEGPYNLIHNFNESTPSNDPFHPNALWDLNWQLEKTDVSLEYPADGTSISIHKGETLGIILPNHRDIDIIWEVDTDELDEGIIEKIGDDQFPGYFYGPSSAPQPARGKEQWIFEAISTGTTTIKMDIIDTIGRIDTFTIEIEVEVR